jgi:hypothetical protein
MSLNVITARGVGGTVGSSYCRYVLGFRYIFSYGICRYLSNDHAYDKLSDREY